MRIVIRSRGLHVDATMRAYLKQELHRIFDPVRRGISSIRLFFAALKDPDRGMGCRIVVKLARSDRTVIATATGPHFSALTDRVLRRAGTAVRRRLHRKYARRRRRNRRVLAAGNSANI